MECARTAKLTNPEFAIVSQSRPNWPTSCIELQSTTMSSEPPSADDGMGLETLSATVAHLRRQRDHWQGEALRLADETRALHATIAAVMHGAPELDK